jgi:hypothetical protein
MYRFNWWRLERGEEHTGKQAGIPVILQTCIQRCLVWITWLKIFVVFHSPSRTFCRDLPVYWPRWGAASHFISPCLPLYVSITMLYMHTNSRNMHIWNLKMEAARTSPTPVLCNNWLYLFLLTGIFLMSQDLWMLATVLCEIWGSRGGKYGAYYLLHSLDVAWWSVSDTENQ